MKNNLKYLYLIRNLHRAEKELLAWIPINKMIFTFNESVAWEQLENLGKNAGFTKLAQILKSSQHRRINKKDGNKKQ